MTLYEGWNENDEKACLSRQKYQKPSDLQSLRLNRVEWQKEFRLTSSCYLFSMIIENKKSTIWQFVNMLGLGVVPLDNPTSNFL